jgi:hypothetical protein
MARRWLSVLWIIGALAGAFGQGSGEADSLCRTKRRYYRKAYEAIEKLLDRIDVLIHYERHGMFDFDYDDSSPWVERDRRPE